MMAHRTRKASDVDANMAAFDALPKPIRELAHDYGLARVTHSWDQRRAKDSYAMFRRICQIKRQRARDKKT